MVGIGGGLSVVYHISCIGSRELPVHSPSFPGKGIAIADRDFWRKVTLHVALILELDELDIGLVHCDNEYDGKALLLHNLSPTWYPSVPPLPSPTTFPQLTASQLSPSVLPLFCRQMQRNMSRVEQRRARLKRTS